MASTNKTTNYELSQYIGTDKPTYLGDYNSDMSKIDTQMKANETASGIAKTTADTALKNAETAQTEASQALNTGNNANQTATSALEKATANEAKITANEAKITEINNKFVYSTEEQVIGKWIDGKTLYRKVLSFNGESGDTWHNISHGISNVDRIFIKYASFNYNSEELIIPNDVVKEIKASLNYVSYFGNVPFATTVILEYTKSTD